MKTDMERIKRMGMVRIRPRVKRRKRERRYHFIKHNYDEIKEDSKGEVKGASSVAMERRRRKTIRKSVNWK